MRILINLLGSKLVLVSLSTLGLLASGYTQSLTWIIRYDRYTTGAMDVSDDGVVVVGNGINFIDTYQPPRGFVRTATGGLMDFGPGGVWGVSADGSVMVGFIFESRTPIACRWTLNGGMHYLTSASAYSYANGVSADGTVVVGSWGSRAAIWRVGSQMQTLSSVSQAFGVSADGRVVVGERNYRAFRWTIGGGIQDLGVLPGGQTSCAYGVSGDGTVVVGQSSNRAFLWTPTSGMQDLGVLSGNGASCAYGVSSDGTIVVGWSEDARGQSCAFRWTAERGMEDLNLLYANLLGSEARLGVARAVSSDGRYIVGSGKYGTLWWGVAFLLDTWRYGDTNGDGCIDDSDLLSILLAFGTPGTGYTRHEDINKDGVVDDADLLIVLHNFRQGC